ncbi:MAG: DUF2169 domain-containing protein [Polyangiaceae bacterium]
MAATWPVEIVAEGGVSCGAVFFRHRGSAVLTIVVKASFGLVHGGAMALAAAPEIAREDRTFEGRPGRSLEIASDLSPFLRRCDVLFRGHAHAQKGQAAPASAVRLALFRDARPLVDKTIRVFAQSGGHGASWELPRAMYPVGAGARDQLFDRMPIVYERAYGGPDVAANPAGTRMPNLVDPADPTRPAGFGPIAPSWPQRARLLAGRRLDPAAFPDDLDWAYFQAAPTDQQTDYLQGGEWLVLDGLHPELPRLQSRLPIARGVARIRVPDGTGARELPVELQADTLSIDGDFQKCSVTWRGHHRIEGNTPPFLMRVRAGLELPDRPVSTAQSAPASAPPRPPRAHACERAPAVAPLPRRGGGARSVKHQTMALPAEPQGSPPTRPLPSPPAPTRPLPSPPPPPRERPTRPHARTPRPGVRPPPAARAR